MENIDGKISRNIQKIIKEKFRTGTECAKAMGVSARSLNDSVNKIKLGKYPSVKQLKRIANVCECEITDFFKVD